MKIFKKVFFLLTLVLIVTSCEDNESQIDYLEENSNDKFEFSLKGNNTSVFYNNGKSSIYKNNSLYMTYEVIGDNFSVRSKNKNANQYEFYNVHKDKTFLLDNITIIDDYSFSFDLYADDDLIESNLVFQSENEKIISDNKCWWCFVVEAVEAIVEEVTDAFETSTQNETCQDAILACSSAGGIPSVQSTDNGCMVICNPKNGD